MTTHHQIASLLIDLEAVLRHCGLWSDEAPTAEAMASTEPFALDTMPLQAWLQFIFVPTLRRLLEAGAAMPAKCEVLPVAEEAFAKNNRELFAVIAQLDKLISEG